MVILIASNKEKATKGHVAYDEANKSFDTVPKTNVDISLLISYVNVGFDSETMSANQIWGFSPRECWIEKDMQHPTNFSDATLKLESVLEPGSWRLDRESQWKSYFNPRTGWFCMGDSDLDTNDSHIAFLENAIAVLNAKGELKTLWIHL